MKTKRVKVGIIGTGNIGSDLLKKVLRSHYLECGIFTGQNPDSEGIKRAKKLGVTTSFTSIKAITENPDSCDIVFDATNAESHLKHAPILKKMGKFVIDLTPSRIGKMCVPVINMTECLNEQNINMVTCGGQVTIPIISAIMSVHPNTKYVEIVGSIASKSAGIGTRNNIDKYTQTTKDAIEMLAKAPLAKAIIILNPADPPITMHNTIYAQIDNPNLDLLKKAIDVTAKKVKQYVPGYHVVVGPIADNDKVTIMIEVRGAGDFLPAYAGNLDVINAAAITAAEAYAQKKLLV
ncbi:MAG TPA: acetaldehyde dehydrogenase (acetylating) [Candidatus Acidoferrales bacterium]|nr:acetaldehyde dehydrogenase (acetylating) [Candidatus Acidoferrales bacterium]